ncbi:MAG: PAS domain S-box protein [Deltaproteobacteria bacterium]|nr:PAS domain S-box protein [Deltaproteobacteria bacterium]
MKKTLSITQRFILFVSIFFILAAANLWFYINGAKGLEKYAVVNNIISSIKGDVVALEYAADIFVVAGDFEKGYGTEGLKDKTAAIDKGVAHLEGLPLAAIFGSDIALSGEYHAFLNDWRLVKEKIGGVTKAISREEALLTHNDIDLKTFLIRERLERLGKFIDNENAKAVSDANNRTVYGFIFSAILIFIIAYIFYNKTLKPIKAVIAMAEKMHISDKPASSAPGGEEINTLANVLNSMADAVKMAHKTLEKDISDKTRELEARTKEFAALNRVAGLAGRTLAQEEIVGAALDELMLASEADAGWVYLAEPHDDGGSVTRLRLNAHRGVSHTFIREAKEVKPEEAYVGGQIKGNGHRVMDVADIGNRLKGLLQDMGFKKLCILPIVYENSLIGVISLAGKGANCFSGDKGNSCVFAESMASEMAIAIGHAKLFQKEFKSKQFLERIIEQSPVSMAVFDKNGVCVMLNTTCKNLFGIANDDQVIGKYNLLKDNELEEKGYAHLVHRIFEGESVDMEIEYDISNVRHIQIKAGPKRLKLKIFPIFDNDGSVSNIAVMYEDAAKETVRK